MPREFFDDYFMNREDHAIAPSPPADVGRWFSTNNFAGEKFAEERQVLGRLNSRRSISDSLYSEIRFECTYTLLNHCFIGFRSIVCAFLFTNFFLSLLISKSGIDRLPSIFEVDEIIEPRITDFL